MKKSIQCKILRTELNGKKSIHTHQDKSKQSKTAKKVFISEITLYEPVSFVKHEQQQKNYNRNESSLRTG